MAGGGIQRIRIPRAPPSNCRCCRWRSRRASRCGNFASLQPAGSASSMPGYDPTTMRPCRNRRRSAGISISTRYRPAGRNGCSMCAAACMTSERYRRASIDLKRHERDLAEEHRRDCRGRGGTRRRPRQRTGAGAFRAHDAVSDTGAWRRCLTGSAGQMLSSICVLAAMLRTERSATSC